MQQRLVTLMIDDDQDDQEIFSIALKEISPSAQCVFANDGIYALDELTNDAFKPDIIFIDINMPRMNGVQCLTEIKKLSKLQQTPVYMYSTSYESIIVEECLRIGAAGFLKKEINPENTRQQLSQIFIHLKMHSL
jgi:CheY-like chemotaxis protein